MRVFIASDEPSVATTLRGCLGREHGECTWGGTLTLDEAVRTLRAGTESIDALLVVLPEQKSEAIATISRLRPLTQAWLVGIGRVETPADVLGLLHHGADDFVDCDADLAEQVAVVLKSPRIRSDVEPRQVSQTVAVTSASGGSGASTIAANLAATLSQSAGACGLFDFDLEKGDLAYLLNLKPRHTLDELTHNSTAIDRTMLAQSVVGHECGVQLIAAPRNIGDQREIDVRQLHRILELGSTMFPVNVVDCGRQAGAGLHVQLLRNCDRVLVVLKLDFTGVWNARRTLDALERERIDLSKVLLVVNRRGMPAEISPAKAKRILGSEVSHSIPNDETTANFCVNCGMPYILEAPRKAISKAVRTLGRTLVGEPVSSSPRIAAAPSLAARLGSTGERLLRQAAGVVLSMRPT